MQTNFNKEELSLVLDKRWFELKASASGKTTAMLHEVDEMMRIGNKIICLDETIVSKITKGENLKGFPYFVLDAPKLREEPMILSIRIIAWWGNYISVNLLLGEEVYKKFKESIIKNLSHAQDGGFYVSISENLWQHDLYDDEHFIEGSAITKEQLNRLMVFKISKIVKLDSENSVKEIAEAAETLNSILL